MNGNGRARSSWGYAVERQPRPMLAVALQALRREGAEPVALAECNGDAGRWVRAVAECLGRGECGGAVVFCDDAGLACCVANKVPGIRAAAVWTVAQAERAVRGLGANVLAVEQSGRTFYEFKQILRLCCTGPAADCPPGVARVLRELDGHAHR
jgi:hypothetical protein